MASKSSSTGQSASELRQLLGKGSLSNRQFVLKSRPTGALAEDNFEFKAANIVQPQLNEVLVRVLYVSFDPYMRWRMNESKASYVGSFEIGKPIVGYLTGQVIESNSSKYKPGDLVTGTLPFAEYITVPAEQVEHVPEIVASGDTKITHSLGILGMPGETAYIGIYHIGKPKPGDTVLVSGAAGAVGSLVGQLAKLCGCNVVGIVGSKQKEEFIVNTLKFDKAINYKTTKNMSQAIKEACPNGVDVYWDNVGGELLEAAIENIAKFGRVVVCGAISQYQELHKQPSMKSPSMILLTRSASILGFIVFDYSHLYPEAIKGMSHFIRKGQITIEETVMEGFDKAPKAFVGLFKGENLGKMLVSVAQPLSFK